MPPALSSNVRERRWLIGSHACTSKNLSYAIISETMNHHPYKIGIIGGGAVGLAYATILSEQADVVIKTRRPEQADAINAHGITVRPPEGTPGHKDETFTKARATTDWTDLTDRDAVIVSVKSFDNPAVAADLAANLAPDTIILSLQNGLEALPALKEHLPHPDRIFGSVIYIGTSRADDHTIVTTGPRRIIVDRRAGKLAEIMKSTRFPAEETANIKQAIWDKMVLNISQNALCTVTNRNVGQLITSPDCLDIIKHILAEFQQEWETEGLKFDYDLMDKVRASFKGLTFYPSMWQDIHAGRRTEIDAINGAISKLGRKHRIPTPYNDMITSLIKALEI